MGRAAVPLDTIWPNGCDPKTLVCVRAQCSVADLFNTVFGEPDLTEQLHKQRGDAELVETPWYPDKEDLPQQLYTWQVADPPNKPTDTLRHRKVRFESPPTALASKPFQNEELQVITELYPDTLYVVEAVSSTSAPYGDKFNVFFRYIFRAADGTSSSALHVQFHVEWLPAMNRMMRPVVGKAIDAGVRGTFRIFRTVLGNLQSVVDIKETEMPVGGPPAFVTHEPPVAGEAAEGGPVEAAMMAPNPPPYPAPAAGFAPGLGPPPGLLSVMTQQLVYKDQVVLLADLLGAGLRSVSASDVGAQLMAAALTIWLISVVVAALRAWQVVCADRAGGGDGAGGVRGGNGLMWLLQIAVCWPLKIVDLPDSTAEVLASLALVAAINWAVIRGSEAVVRYVSKKYPGLLTPPRGGPGGGGDVIGGVPFSQTPVTATRGSSGGGAGLGAGARSAGAFGSGVGSPPSTSTSISRVASSIAAGGPGAAAGALASSSVAGGKDKEKDKFGRGHGGGGGGVTGGQSFLAAAMASAAGKVSQSRPLRAAPPPRQFTAAQMRQLELGHMSGANKNGGTSAAPPAVSLSADSITLPAPAVADAWAADVPGGVMTPTLEAPTVAPRPTSPPPPRRQPSPPPRSAPAAADAAGPTAVVGRTVSRSSAATAAESSGGGSPGARVAVATAPVAAAPAAAVAPVAAVAAAPAAAAAQPPPVALSPSKPAVPSAPQHAAGAHASGATQLTAASTFANMFTKEGIDSMAESLRSAFRWDVSKTSDAGDMASPELSTSPASHAQQHLAKLKARSDAGGSLSEAAAAAAAPGRRVGSAVTASGLGLRSGGAGVLHSSTGAPLLSVQSDMPLLPHEVDLYGGGEDDEYDSELEPEVVVEEVFENERFQPFRGWGHNWPGHFLPSDRVGHWSDRQGKPGGSASMVFEQVVPQLPTGWRWMEDDWQVDLEGLEVESVDHDGWTYALDFYLLKYPPPPQGGKCSLKHFVRRRRYYRTRVREEGRRSTRSSGDSPLGGPLTAGGLTAGVGADADGGEEPEGDVRTDGDYPLAVERTLLSLSDGIKDVVSDTTARRQLTQAASGPAAAAPPPSTDGAAAASGRSLELRPPAATAALPRPHSAADGLAALLTPPPQQQGQGDRRFARTSLSGLTAGTAAGAIQSAPVDGLSSAPGSQRDRHGDADGASALSSSPTELFILSPKTEVTSHDPLGALTEAPPPVAADRERQPPWTSAGERQARNPVAAAAATTAGPAADAAAQDHGSGAAVAAGGAPAVAASGAIRDQALPTGAADDAGGGSGGGGVTPPAAAAATAPAPAGPPAAAPAAPGEATAAAAVAGAAPSVTVAAEAPDDEPPGKAGGDGRGGASAEHRTTGAAATAQRKDATISQRVVQSPMKAKETMAAAPPLALAAAGTPPGAETSQAGDDAAVGPAAAVVAAAQGIGSSGVPEGPVIAAEHVE